MNEDQFQQAIAGTTEQRDVQVRQVSNGFALVGNRRFLEPGTAAIRLAQTVEAIAADTAGVVTAMTNFMQTGAFTAAA